MLRPEPAADDAPEAPGWQKVRPRTLVDQAVDAIVAGAARGLILPGDRIVETELARALEMSRIPVREALRLLESQGMVVNEPYKGIRLTPVTRQRLEQVIEVRIALETTAARRALARRCNRGAGLQRLRTAIDELELMATRRDAYGVACADAAFHRELCRLSGNDVLCTVWESLSRQLTVIVGLSTLDKPMEGIVDEHRVLLDTFARGKAAEIDRALNEHIRVQNTVIDFEHLIAERRRARDGARPAATARGKALHA